MPEQPYSRFSSKVIPLPAENVDTDQIVPARFLKITDKAGLADALFRDWRFEADGSRKAPTFVLDKPEMAGRRILLAGDNFGCGSSREHAPWALVSWGIAAVITTSCADIFRGNSLKNGLLTVVLEQKTVDALWELTEKNPTAEVTVDLEAREVRAEGITASFELDENSRWRLLNGLADISITLQNEADISTYEAKRPSYKPRTLQA